MAGDSGDGTYTVSPDLNHHGPVTLGYDVVDGDGETRRGDSGLPFNLQPENDEITAITDENGATNEVPENTVNGASVGITADSYDPDLVNTGEPYDLVSDDEAPMLVGSPEGRSIEIRPIRGLCPRRGILMPTISTTGPIPCGSRPTGPRFGP